MGTLQIPKFFLILGIVIGNASCTKQEESTRLIEKNIADLTSRINLASNQTDKVLLLNSPGGRTSVSLLISDLIISNNISITVTKECLSNCAEILLPSANEIRFTNSPIIGFHGNMQSYQDFVQRYAERNTQYCNWVYAHKERILTQRKSLKNNFWQEQMKRLQPSVRFEYAENTCPWREYNFINRMWLPTSSQLRDMWGLKFQGSVCADDFIMCAEKVDRRWKKGSRIVIGNKIYVSKGRF